ncbi:MAG: hypothetical protein V1779_12405 [bacterium]
MKKILKKSEIIFAVILLIGFFLPWFNQWGKYSGLKVPLLLYIWPAEGIGSDTGLWIRIFSCLFFIVYLIPILCALIIIQAIRKKKTIIFSLATGIIIYLLLIYNMIAWTLYVFHELLFGAWIMLIAGLLLIITAILKNKFDNLVS